MAKSMSHGIPVLGVSYYVFAMFLEAWVESRRIQKDVEEVEFLAAWEKVRKSGFEHAWDSLKEELAKARDMGYSRDAQVFEAQITKLRQVFANPTEELEKY